MLWSPVGRLRAEPRPGWTASQRPLMMLWTAPATGIEVPNCGACATSHHWAREIAKFGHEVRLMPARYVKPCVKRNKNDAADAEAICEAVTRPTMRFVEVKISALAARGRGLISDAASQAGRLYAPGLAR